MTGAVIKQVLRADRKSIVWWLVGLVAVVLMYLSFYPSIADNAQSWDKLLQSLPKAFQGFIGPDYTSPPGYLQAEFFGSMGFVVILVLFVGRGIGAIAGDESNGRSELVLAGPISRERYLLERFGALIVDAVLVSTVIVVALLALGPIFDLKVGIGPLIAGTASAVLGALVFGMVGFFVGAATGNRGLALGVGAAIATAGFLYTLLSPIAQSLSDLQFLSPCWQAFGYSPLVEGLDWGRLGTLVAEIVILLVGSLLLYRRRDLH